MFCYQCQEASKGIGCNIIGVCGKSANVSNLLDFLVYTCKEISKVIIDKNLRLDKRVIKALLKSLFMSITNVNFNEDAIISQINENARILNSFGQDLGDLDKVEILKRVKDFKYGDGDIRSLKDIITFGIKGISAYALHAYNLGFFDEEICRFICEALKKTLDDKVTSDELIAFTFKTGEYGVKVMDLLYRGNTSKYGFPEMTSINIGTREKPGILVSGHDLHDLEMLLEQTKGSGVDVYTHSEMLPAHTYPYFKKYDNLYGNYGNAWHRQLEEFKTFKGPILFTTNCIVPPKDESIKDRIFTSGASGYPGCVHIKEDENGYKDFTPIIELAKTLGHPEEIESGEILGGFSHNQLRLLSDKIIENIKNGNIKEFVVMAGCDGRMAKREFYTEFAKNLPKSSVILTAGCAKYRYNKLPLGDINGIPRVIDAGQCNDSYSLVRIALDLKDVLGVKDINDLPIRYEIAWYEQKAVTVLLSLLYLGVKNINLGPTLPAFITPNVLKLLVDKFNIGLMGRLIS